MFAYDLTVDYRLHQIGDMRSLDPADYGGHPGLKLPTLLTVDGPVYGALNICRWFAAHSTSTRPVVWSDGPELANAQEIVWLGMNAQVNLIVATKIFGLSSTHLYVEKLRTTLIGVLFWLEKLDQKYLDEGDDNPISLFRYSLFTLIEHIKFQSNFEVSAFSRLSAFSAALSEYPSAQATPFVVR